MKNFKVLTIGFLALAIALPAFTGCSGNKRTAIGAGAGAVVGGAVGAVIGNRNGNTGRGAAIGGAVGAAVGAIIGRELDQQARELEANMEGVDVVRVGDSIQVTFDSGLLFAFGRADLQGAAKTNLDDLAASMQQNPNTQLAIIGHTDSVGSDATNQTLSQNRANAVKNYLVSKGVAASRMSSSGLGESKPVASNDSDAGRAQNRRVEVFIEVTEAYRQQLIQQEQAKQQNK